MADDETMPSVEELEPEKLGEEVLSVTEMAERYLANLPALQRAVGAQKIEVIRMLKSQPDLKVRMMLEQQALVWDVQLVTIGSFTMILHMLLETYRAMGCDVSRKVH